MPATTSSAITPRPPARRLSTKPIGKGLTISKNLNTTNATEYHKIVFGTNHRETAIPTTSSITVHDGSAIPVFCSTLFAAIIPTKKIMIQVTIQNDEKKLGTHQRIKPVNKLAAVPGAHGTNPTPATEARKNHSWYLFFLFTFKKPPLIYIAYSCISRN